MTLKQALIACITAAPMLASGDEVSFLVTHTDSGAPLAEAVILLPLPAEESSQGAQMVQRGRQFVPHVLTVSQGSNIAFPNQDNTQHHVYSFSPAKPFEIELYAGEPKAPIRFDNTGVVELGCNIHDNMQAFILVTDQRNGMTDAEGTVTLPWPDDRPLPEQIQVWHPRLPDNSRVLDYPLVVPAAGEPVAITLEVEPAPEPDNSLQRLQQRYREL